MDEKLTKLIQDHNDTVKLFFEQNEQKINDLIDLVEIRLKNGGKFICFGNGGSASDSAHFVAELLGRFEKERKSIPAIDLTSSNSTITAIGNDYGYEEIFSRQVEGLANKNDIIFGISTSGKSANVLKAFESAPQTSLKVLLTSSKIEPFDIQLEKTVDFIFKVPSTSTARTQEVHIMFLHILAGLIEERM
jgi:D-sedoheptulose 7-phosphate isomerase